MSERYLPKEIISFCKSDLGLEEVQEISSATIRMIISQYYIKAIRNGFTIEELAKRAGMDVVEFKSTVLCGSYEHVGVLARLAYALNFEIILEFNSKENGEETL